MYLQLWKWKLKRRKLLVPIVTCSLQVSTDSSPINHSHRQAWVRSVTVGVACSRLEAQS